MKFLPAKQFNIHSYSVNLHPQIIHVKFPLSGPKFPGKSIPEETLGKTTSDLIILGEKKVLEGHKETNLLNHMIQLSYFKFTETFPLHAKSGPS